MVAESPVLADSFSKLWFAIPVDGLVSRTNLSDAVSGTDEETEVPPVRASVDNA